MARHAKEREKALNTNYQTWPQSEILQAKEHTHDNLVNPHTNTN